MNVRPEEVRPLAGPGVTRTISSLLAAVWPSRIGLACSHSLTWPQSAQAHELMLTSSVHRDEMSVRAEPHTLCKACRRLSKCHHDVLLYLHTQPLAWSVACPSRHQVGRQLWVNHTIMLLTGSPPCHPIPASRPHPLFLVNLLCYAVAHHNVVYLLLCNPPWGPYTTMLTAMPLGRPLTAYTLHPHHFSCTGYCSCTMPI